MLSLLYRKYLSRKAFVSNFWLKDSETAFAANLTNFREIYTVTSSDVSAS